VITWLWKVPGEARRELTLDLDRRLGIEKTPKVRALWEPRSASATRRTSEGG